MCGVHKQEKPVNSITGNKWGDDLIGLVLFIITILVLVKWG